MKLEIERYKLGRVKFNQWVHELESNYNLLSAYDLENERVPDARNYGRLMTAIGSVNLRGFYGLLVKQFERYGLVGYQVGVWDGSYFMSNCGERKQ